MARRAPACARGAGPSGDREHRDRTGPCGTSHGETLESDHHRRGPVVKQQFELLRHGTSSDGDTSADRTLAAEQQLAVFTPAGRARYRNNAQAIEEIGKLITTP